MSLLYALGYNVLYSFDYSFTKMALMKVVMSPDHVLSHRQACIVEPPLGDGEREVEMAKRHL